MTEPETASPEPRRSPWPTKVWAGARWALIVTLSLVLLAPIVGPWVTGSTWVMVTGGSMAPSLQVGDIVLVEDVAPEDVGIGDVVTFTSRSGGWVTHRVIAEDDDGSWETRGDANSVTDPHPVTAADLVGRVDGSLSGVPAAIIRAAQSGMGRISLLGLLAILLFVAPARPRSAESPPS